jgi:hypothetical protein
MPLPKEDPNRKLFSPLKTSEPIKPPQKTSDENRAEIERWKIQSKCSHNWRDWERLEQDSDGRIVGRSWGSVCQDCGASKSDSEDFDDEMIEDTDESNWNDYQRDTWYNC